MRTHQFPTTSRRTVLRTSAILGGAGLGLGAYALHGSQPARAEVTSSFSLAAKEYAEDDAELYDVWVYGEGTWSFRTETTPDGWQLTLEVSPDGTDGSYEPIAQDSGGAISGEMASSYAVNGPLSSHSAWANGDFTADPESSVDFEVYVRVTFEVLAADGSIMASAEATDSGIFTVTNTAFNTSASFDGSGEFLVQVNSTDAEPTPSG